MANERIEAQFTVPASTTASASNGAQASATTITFTSGATYQTSFLADLQTQLNQNVQGFPTNASAMQTALGYGTWTSGAGWLFQEASGNPAATFGAPALTATTLTYQNAGTQTGDYAVGFSAGTSNGSAGNNFNVTATDDFAICWVGYLSALPAATRALFTKYTTTGWFLQLQTSGAIQFGADKAGPANDFLIVAGATMPVGEWHVGIATVDRATGKARVGVRGLTSGTTTVSAEATATASSYSNAANMTMGLRADSGTNACTELKVSALYVVKGSSVASGISASLSTALTNFASAVNSTWSVALSSSTGLTTISNSFWPAYVAFGGASTARDVAGYAYDFDYPQTAAQMQTALGYGTWSASTGAGYLCNEASGSLAPIFGSTSLVAVSSPTYSNLGPRGGADKAVGFDSVNDAFSGGNIFDVGASDDLILVFLAKATSTSSVDIIGKDAGAATGYLVVTGASLMRLFLSDGTHTGLVDVNVYPQNEWMVCVAVVDRARNVGRIGVSTLTTNATTVGTETSISTVGSLSNANNFRIGDQGLNGATNSPLIGAVYVAKGPGVATGLSANLSTALTNFATYMKSQTGTIAPAGVWFPGCPYAADSDPKQAPKGDNSMAQVAPDGSVYAVQNTTYYRHRNVRFSHVAQSKTWANSATISGADWQTFYLETQLGQHSWFSVRSKVKVYWDNAGTVTELGSGGVSGWRMPMPQKLDEITLSVPGYTGLCAINLGDLYSAS